MVAPSNLSFEIESGEATPAAWVSTFVSAARQRANYAVKGFDASAAVHEAGSYTLPPWLTIECPTATRTAQTSATTVQAGLGANAARRFSQDGATFGLLVEPSATNIIDEQDFGQWSDNGLAVSSATGPTGLTDAQNIDDSDAGAIENRLRPHTMNLTPHTISMWTKYNGSYTNRILVWSQNSGSLFVQDNVGDTDWTYRHATSTVTVATANSLMYARSDAAAGVGSADIYGYQVEERSYPTSFIGVDNTTFTRAADTLHVNDSDQVMWGDGYLILTMVVEMLFDAGDEDGDFYVWWVDEDNHLMWNNGSAEFLLTIGGTGLAAAVGTTWNRGDAVTFVITNTPSTTSLAVTGGTTSSEATVGLVPKTTMHLLGTNAGSTEAFALRSVDFEVAPTGFEKFYEGWSTSFVVDLASSTLALYSAGVLPSPLAYDQFDEWDPTYATTIVGTAATYDVYVENPGRTHEGFTEGWNATVFTCSFDVDGDAVLDAMGPTVWVDPADITPTAGEVQTVPAHGSSSVVFEQQTAGNRPGYSSSNAALNNQPSIDIDDNLDFLQTTVAGAVGTITDSTLITCANSRTPGASGQQEFHLSASDQYYASNGSGDMGFWDGTSHRVAGAHAAGAHVTTWKLDSSGSPLGQCFRDGTQIGSNTGYDGNQVGFGTAKAAISSNGGAGGAGWQLGYLFLVKAVLTATQQEIAESIIGTRFGVSGYTGEKNIDIQCAGHSLVVDDRVYFSGTLPPELSGAILYWVVAVTASTIQVSATMSGAPIMFTETIGDANVSSVGHDGVFDTTITSSTVGDYHPGAGTDETFEAGTSQGWDTSYVTTLTTPTAAAYDSGGTPENFEDFEEVEARRSFAVNVGSDLIVDASNPVSNGDTITFTSTGALPGGLLAEITYYVVNRAAGNFQVSLTSGGAAVTITDSGTGVHQYIQDQTQYWTTTI